VRSVLCDTRSSWPTTTGFTTRGRTGNMPSENVPREIARLRGLIARIDEVDRRGWAANLLDSWTSESSKAFRKGIAEIAAIAEEAEDEGEQDAVLDLNELLGTLIDGIEYDQQHSAGS